MSADLTVAVVGAGYFARYHHDAWNRLGEARLVAICDQDLSKANDAASLVGNPRVFDDVATMLETVKPDIVDIATPPTTHAAFIRELLTRKITTVCQKPFCLSIDEAKSVVALAKANNTRLIVHENFRFQPWFRSARDRIDSGDLGDLYSISFRLRPGDGQGPDAYLNRQPYFQKMPRFLIRETGIHFIDTFRYLMGEVTGVFARLNRLNPVMAGEDAGIVHFDFTSGARGLFDANRLSSHAAANRRLTMGEMLIEGSKAVLTIDGFGRLSIRAHADNAAKPISGEWQARGFGGDSVLRLQEHVINHLRAGTPLETGADGYIRNLEIENAIYKSNETATYIAI